MQSVYVYWHINKQILGGKICGCKQLHKNVRNWSQNRRIRRGTTESTWPNGDSVDAHFMQSKTVLWTQGQWRRHASQQLHWRLRRIREVKRCPSSTWQGLRAAVCQTALWGRSSNHFIIVTFPFRLLKPCIVQGYCASFFHLEHLQTKTFPWVIWLVTMT